MPTAAEHHAVYQDSLAFLNSGIIVANPRWAAVVAFYAGVHLVERLAAQDGVHNARHVGTNSRQVYLAQHPVHHVLLAELTALRSASELARYHSLAAFDAAFAAADVQAQLIAACLATIEAHVVAAFAPPPAPVVPVVP